MNVVLIVIGTVVIDHKNKVFNIKSSCSNGSGDLHDEYALRTSYGTMGFSTEEPQNFTKPYQYFDSTIFKICDSRVSIKLIDSPMKRCARITVSHQLRNNVIRLKISF